MHILHYIFPFLAIITLENIAIAQDKEPITKYKRINNVIAKSDSTILLERSFYSLYDYYYLLSFKNGNCQLKTLAIRKGTNKIHSKTKRLKRAGVSELLSTLNKKGFWNLDNTLLNAKCHKTQKINDSLTIVVVHEISHTVLYSYLKCSKESQKAVYSENEAILYRCDNESDRAKDTFEECNRMFIAFVQDEGMW